MTHDPFKKTDFDVNVYTPLIRSFHDYFLANRDKKTMQVSQEVLDNYLKGMQESQRQESKVEDGRHIFYSIVGKREIEVV
jgi:hypothetical protein